MGRSAEANYFTHRGVLENTGRADRIKIWSPRDTARSFPQLMRGLVQPTHAALHAERFWLQDQALFRLQKPTNDRLSTRGG